MEEVNEESLKGKVKKINNLEVGQSFIYVRVGHSFLYVQVIT